MTSVNIDWSLFITSADQGYSTTSPIYNLEMNDCKGSTTFNSLLLSTTVLTTYPISSVAPGTICNFRMRV
jgi:hypothetical protein